MTQSSLFATYARADLKFEKGEGAWLTTQDNRRFLDFAAGIAVNSLGHAHPHLVDALKAQAEKLWHVSNLYDIPGQQRLGERLCAATFADKVFFTNSGAEALECAVKTARRYHYGKGNVDKTTIITFDGAFHGRTLAMIAAGGQEKYLEGFGEKAPGFVNLPAPDIDLVKSAVGETTAAILIEPIQGEGGIREIAPSFLQALRSLCDELDILLIYDEVQTGVGRTGYLFAHQEYGIEPDIMAIAKGIGGGFPMGACMAREEVAQAMVPGTHGSTYGGNPLAMAVGNAVLDVVLEEGFLERVRDISLVLKQRLAEIRDAHSDILTEIRGRGLLLGLKLTVPPAELLAACRGEGLLAVPAGDNVLRLAPPLIIGQEEIDFAMNSLDKALAKVSANQKDNH
ncbi:acetylornithine aminotransferase apoenzyme [Cohaesibacter sp. ES.047]|uniref:aspartate aminotransferase family protein n=1 Tax=Cohaesibacter sp. ES.047 TaxID=1798205 RepID=UPI000BB8F7C7|nr:aspartate aminotransferase family protein [Cohaesibacter sp. ES.047]SNY91788.1 acetylornithine aminotransferase apoenzyme [Cohaesibacter sp. ES.047]